MKDIQIILTELENCLDPQPCRNCPRAECESFDDKKKDFPIGLIQDAYSLLKAYSSQIGFEMLSDKFSFTSIGNAAEGMKIGNSFGCSWAKEQIARRLYLAGLLTDDIIRIIESVNIDREPQMEDAHHG